MSSSAPGPYKSKLFNLFNRQSLHLKERLAKAGRHLKVAVEWGVQILAYPIYAIVQTGRMAGRQLGTKVEQAQLSPSPTDSQHSTPSADATIERVLETVDLWLSPTSEPASSNDLADSVLSPTDQQDAIVQSTGSKAIAKMSTMVDILPQATESNEARLTICGVASLLETRNLVLVAPDNQIVDILSPQQQKELQKRIYWEIANYWYRHRLLSKAAHPFPELVPSFEEGSENVLPPAKLFWKVIRWMQTSQLAIAVNLFGESTIVRSDAKIAAISSLNHTFIPDKPLLETLSDRLQELGRQPLEPLSDRNFQELLQAAVDYFFGKHNRQSISEPPQASSVLPSSELQQPKPLLPDLVQKFKTGLAGKSSNLSDSEPDPFQIQALVRAAIDHFFGQHQGQHLRGRAEKVLSPQTNASDDPWLSWDDLYADATFNINSNPHNPDPAQPKQLTSASTPSTLPMHPARMGKTHATRSQNVKSKKSLSKTRRSSRLQKTHKATQRQPLPKSERPSSLARSNPADNSLKVDPDWIETKATPVGYVKHPLVRVLEWLDLAMLWLEDVLVKFWQWLRQRF
jgi:hypothetical protein